MKTANYQNEVDLADFAKNVFSLRRKLFIGLSLCVFISVVAGFVVPIPHQAWAIVKIGIIREPLLRRVDVENKFADPQIILPVLKKFDRGLTDRKIKDIIVVEDMDSSDEVKLVVKYPDPKISVDICNSIAELFVSQGSASFIKKKNLLEEEISQLQEINERNKNKMETLYWQIVDQEIQNKDSRIKGKKGKTDVFVPVLSVDNSAFQSNEGMVLYYRAASLALAEKIDSIKNLLMSSNKEDIDKDQIYYEKKAFLFTEMIAVFEKLQHYYGRRIRSFNKYKDGDFLDASQANELKKYENNYSLILDDVFKLKQQVLSAKDFKILMPAVFSGKQVLAERYNQALVSGCMGFVVGLLIIYLKEFFLKGFF